MSHNLRLFTANNVDRTRTKDNIVFVNISQQEIYEKLFDNAVKEYNAKQKRNDRKITTGYYEDQFGRGYSPNVVTSADKRHSFYEDIVQIGDMKDTGVGTVDAEIAKEVLTEYMNGFEQRNPNFKVFCAVLHMDEATPHLHIDYVPVGHYSRGITVQNGIAQALKEMGYINSIWAGSRQLIAVRGLLAKFRQNDQLQSKLLETKQSFLVECAHSDTIWACGKRLREPERLDASKWTGQNILGFSLMEVRGAIQQNTE